MHQNPWVPYKCQRPGPAQRFWTSLGSGHPCSQDGGPCPAHRPHPPKAQSPARQLPGEPAQGGVSLRGHFWPSPWTEWPAQPVGAQAHLSLHQGLRGRGPGRQGLEPGSGWGTTARPVPLAVTDPGVPGGGRGPPGCLGRPAHRAAVAPMQHKRWSTRPHEGPAPSSHCPPLPRRV